MKNTFSDRDCLQFMSISNYTKQWSSIKILKVRESLIPMTTTALHYSQSIFEGLKIHKNKIHNSISIFRMKDHAKRFQFSAKRIMIPPISIKKFIEGISSIVIINKLHDILNSIPETSSIYIRPLIYASDQAVRVKISNQYTFSVLAYVLHEYFQTHLSVLINDSGHYIRAALGGTGDVKFSGNYAPSFIMQNMADKYKCNEVLWLDSKEHKYIEELNVMNIFFVIRNNNKDSIFTPKPNGTFLNGITRQSVIKISNDYLQIPIYEDKLSIDWLYSNIASNRLVGAFSCGTAGGIKLITEFKNTSNMIFNIPSTKCQTIHEIKDTIINIKRGIIDDIYNWNHIF